MAISIQGVRVSSLSVSRNNEGVPKITGTYELVSSTGFVLAKQEFNGYNTISIGQSPACSKLLLDLISYVETDINNTLGLG